MDINALIEKLGLAPLPDEGGYYVETYRCEDCFEKESSCGGDSRQKSFSTAIYYLLTPDTFSHIHRVTADEVFHFYAGDPLEMLQLHPDGTHSVVTIGPDILNGEHPQVMVPKGVWQGARLKDGGRYALLGTTVSPAFDFEDYEQGERAKLVANYPLCARFIEKLTHG